MNTYQQSPTTVGLLGKCFQLLSSKVIADDFTFGVNDDHKRYRHHTESLCDGVFTVRIELVLSRETTKRYRRLRFEILCLFDRPIKVDAYDLNLSRRASRNCLSC